MSYQASFLNGGTPSADSNYDANTVASKAFDKNIGTRWLSDASAFPHWIKYDLGAAISKKARKLRMYPQGNQVKGFDLEGSNDDSAWTQILKGEATAVQEWQEWEFANVAGYRYYRITVATNHSEGGDTFAGIYEIELMEAVVSATKFNRGLN